MRILHLVTRSQRRGAELVAVELARGLDALGHTNQVLALGLGFDGSEDVDLPPLTRRSDGGFRALWLGARALRRHLAARAGRHRDRARRPRGRGRGARAPARPPAHRVATHPRVSRRRCGGRCAGCAGARSCAASTPRSRSRPTSATSSRRLGFDGPIWAIPNFRDPEPFVAVDRDVAAPRAPRRARRSADDVGLVGFVGHLIEQKRPDRALDALVAMHELGERAHLVVAGDGPLRSRLRARRRRSAGSSEYVHVLGHRNDIAQILAAIDVFILTSDSEGLPGVLIEAQMAGCPIVTVPVGGVRDLVDDGETGVVIDDIDHDELARAGRRAPARPAAARPARRAGPAPGGALLVDAGRRHLRGPARRGRRRPTRR